MIIGFSGYKGAGKNTAADYLTEKYDFRQLSFAASGKRVICETFGITSEQLEQWKNNESYCVTLGESLGSGEYAEGYYETMTFREFLQKLLNEGMKAAYGPMFHTNHLLPMDFQHHGFKYAITDLRFSYEAMRIRELGGYVVEVQRPMLVPTDTHSSEQPLPQDLVDYLLVNDGSLELLHERVDSIISNIAEHYSDREAMAGE